MIDIQNLMEQGFTPGLQMSFGKLSLIHTVCDTETKDVLEAREHLLVCNPRIGYCAIRIPTELVTNHLGQRYRKPKIRK